MNHFDPTNTRRAPTLECNPNVNLPDVPVLQKSHTVPHEGDNEPLRSKGQLQGQTQSPASAQPDWMQMRLRYPALGMCRR